MVSTLSTYIRTGSLAEAYPIPDSQCSGYEQRADLTLILPPLSLSLTKLYRHGGLEWNLTFLAESNALQPEVPRLSSCGNELKQKQSERVWLEVRIEIEDIR